MRLGIPRVHIVTIAALLSAYQVFLGLWALPTVRSTAPVLLAMALYAAATVLSLLPWSRLRLPIWMAAFNVSTVVIISLLVSNELDPSMDGGNGYATWYVAAVGTLLTITSARRRHSFAWAGSAFLVVHTLIWSGFDALMSLGVVGSVCWVAVSVLLSWGLNKAVKDAHRFAFAEREATEWQAAQEAHVFERQTRLDQTSSVALAMLTRIEEVGGDLSEAERAECLFLEGAIRDEIRGRRLLNDAMRREVLDARRRGSTVTLLDEGGIDDLPPSDTKRVLDLAAGAISATRADSIIVRTASSESDTAVTVVGLVSSTEGDDDDVDLWLEIPRNVCLPASPEIER